MSRAFRIPIVSMIAAIALLAGCEEGSEFPFFSGSPDLVTGALPGAEAPSFEVVEQEVEAPDVFAVNEPALWDGRPSLGGLWVAHPDVADAEQVRIRNEANGTTINGALFRRERDIPGPRTQVSSDAAAALGMLAGQPTVLDIVAIRREQVEVPLAVPPQDTVDLGEATGEDIESTSLDDASLEGAAVDEAVLAGSVESAALEAPAPESVDTDAVALAEAAILAVGTGAAAATDASEPAIETTVEASTEAATEAPSEASEEVAAVAAPTTSSLRRPFIQVGIFSVEENALAVDASLREAGVIPTLRSETSGDKSVWRVLVGPANKISERRTMLVKLRELGYQDAYFVRN